jgi:hypothetical protein
MAVRLRFYARGTAQVADPHAQERPNPVRRCVGRRWQEVITGRWSWVPTEKPQEVDYHPDLVKAARDGDLWPADEETAKACGCPFDPTFGGERPETIKEFKARKAEEAKATETAKAAPETKKADAVGGKGDG